MIREYAVVKIIILDSTIGLNNVVEPTGVDMLVHKVATHDTVLDMDQDGHHTTRCQGFDGA